MKKYLSFMAFAMMAVFSLAFVSCGDEDEDEITPEATIVGTWEVTENNFSTTIKEIAGFEIDEIEVEGLTGLPSLKTELTGHRTKPVLGRRQATP